MSETTFTPGPWRVAGKASGYIAYAGTDPEIGSVQIADVPGRLEPGQGEINFVQFFRKLRQVGYEGLVELENNFSRPGADGERLAYEALSAINSAL